MCKGVCISGVDHSCKPNKRPPAQEREWCSASLVRQLPTPLKQRTARSLVVGARPRSPLAGQRQGHAPSDVRIVRKDKRQRASSKGRTLVQVEGVQSSAPLHQQPLTELGSTHGSMNDPPVSRGATGRLGSSSMGVAGAAWLQGAKLFI